jgi:phosphatidylinositol alpha-mannosyltransferase
VRVALVHPFAWPDVRRGGERYLDDLQWYLRGNGHDVDVITGTRGRGEVVDVVHGANRRLRQIPDLVVWRAGVKLREPDTFGVRVLPTLLRHRYEVVHALMPTSALAARLAGQPVVFTLLGHPSEELLAGHAAKRWTLRAAINRAGAVTALSPQVARDVQSAFGREPTVLAPGVRSERYAARPRNATPTILFASALAPVKGLDVLLAAFAIVAATDPDVRLVLSGPGEAEWAFERAGAAIDAYRDRVDNIGPGDPDDLPRKYAEAHVTVLPSRNEAFGLALAESLASGTPVVGCAGGGADEIVTNDVGRIVAYGDPVALASAISEVLLMAKDESIAQRCVTRAYRWDWVRSIGPQHEAIYAEVARG